MGWIGGEKFVLNDIEISARTRNASIAVQSLDDAPINQSKKIFISLAARSIPKTEDQLPFSSEPVEGQLTIKAIRGLKLTKQGANQQGKVVPAPYKDGHYTITVSYTHLASMMAILATIFTVSSILIIPVVYWAMAGVCIAYIRLIKGLNTKQDTMMLPRYRLATKA